MAAPAQPPARDTSTGAPSSASAAGAGSTPADLARHPTPAHASAAGRARVALVHLVGTPYWLHLHRRIDREIPEIELHCLYTHDVPDQPWALDKSSDVRPLPFGAGERAEDRGIFLSARRELARSRHITRWLAQNDVRFVVLYGYNDAGRVRILRWCRRRGIPCLLTSDSNVKLDRASGVKKFVKRLLVGFAVRSMWGVMPFGSAGTEYFLKYGARKERVYRFPAEPDYSVIERTTQADADSAAERFGLRPGRRRIVFCGRLIEVKRLDTLLDAFNSIADKRPDWDLVVIGDGPLKDQLKARVRPDLATRVTWTGFLADAPTIAAVYKGSDVLVLPSQFEQWALVVNEALAAGLAIITSDVVGSADDLLRPGVNGFTFPVGDAAELAEVLLEVTSAEKIDQYKAGSVRVISEWRRTSDPVDGLRRALRDAGIIPAGATVTPRP